MQKVAPLSHQIQKQPFWQCQWLMYWKSQLFPMQFRHRVDCWLFIYRTNVAQTYPWYTQEMTFMQIHHVHRNIKPMEGKFRSNLPPPPSNTARTITFWCELMTDSHNSAATWLFSEVWIDYWSLFIIWEDRYLCHGLVLCTVVHTIKFFRQLPENHFNVWLCELWPA